MKIRLLTLLCLLIFISSCKKETVLKNSLVGDWEYRSTYGGYTELGPYKPVLKGNGNIYRFTKTELQKISKGVVYETISYTIVKEEKQVNIDKTSYKLVTNSQSNPEIPFKISGKRLTLYYGNIALDGWETTYEKL